MSAFATTNEATNKATTRKRKTTRSAGGLKKSMELDHVTVQETFQYAVTHPPESHNNATTTTPEAVVGHGAYVTAIVHSKKYYGILIDQATLQVATQQQLQEEQDSLALNERMKQAVLENVPNANSSDYDDSQPPRPIQKFRYKDGLRYLLATYTNAEALDVARDEIVQACEQGGGMVGQFYYHYETSPLTLKASNGTPDTLYHPSVAFHTFLQSTVVPPWFPLASQSSSSLNKVSSYPNGSSNSSSLSATAASARTSTALVAPAVSPFAATAPALLPPLTIPFDASLMPMQPRTASQYKIVVVGGGLAGLSCAKRLLTLAKERGILLHVTVLEARDRWGGRVCTTTTPTESSIPLDLGAAWIHGVDQNPLTHLAATYHLELCRPVSETVQMLNQQGTPVDAVLDQQVNRLFDQLLDVAAEDCWGNPEESNPLFESQPPNPWHPTAVRWYAETLRHSMTSTTKLDIPLVPVPEHRESSDISLDWSIGRALVNKKLRAFEKLSPEGRSLLLWHVKNLEYALGANVSDLSMQYWDIDDRNAFEGDHVLMQRGFGSLIDALVHDLQTLATSKSQLFEGRLSCPVQKIEYGRKTTTVPIATVANASSLQPHEQPLVALSDTCCVTLNNGEKIDCDFVISAIPLGVLKQAVKAQTSKEAVTDGKAENTLVFDPPLPFSKTDAISNMGFGLLNKLYLHFDRAFWRTPSSKGIVMFGNTSSVHPQHYMFTDVGHILSPSNSNKDEAPAVLVSLISGRDAALSELLSEAQVVEQAMQVLRTIFASSDVPEPIRFQLTHWGKDPYSRGSYTFLPPGTTDQDFTVLQSPLNKNGDAVTLSSVGETMRLFFCGEHTTALHPSLAHGAWLSGVRAAEQVLQNMTMEFGNSTNSSTNADRWIPLSLYRHDNPQTDLRCHLCHHRGTTLREGTLLAFARGTRQVVVHNACAEWSPEVEVMEEQWRNVVPCVNRAQRFLCSLCGRTGASIPCSIGACNVHYHFRCAEDTGWRFDTHGKEFLCGKHRNGSDCVRISLPYYKEQNPFLSNELICCLCNKSRGEMLAFQLSTPQSSPQQYAVAHTTCVQHSNLVDLELDRGSRSEFDYRKFGALLECARTCNRCKNEGATIQCRHCHECYHYECALSTKWKFQQKRLFCCPNHRTNSMAPRSSSALSTTESSATFLQHALFSLNDSSKPQEDIPGNLDISTTRIEHVHEDDKEDEETESSWMSDDDVSELDEIEQQQQEIMDNNTGEVADDPEENAPAENLECSDLLTAPEEEGESHLCRLHRNSVTDLWNVDFIVTRRTGGSSFLQIAAARADPFDNLQDGDTVIAINGVRIGDARFATLDQILTRLGQEIDTLMEVQRRSW